MALATSDDRRSLSQPGTTRRASRSWTIPSWDQRSFLATTCSTPPKADAGFQSGGAWRASSGRTTTELKMVGRVPCERHDTGDSELGGTCGEAPFWKPVKVLERDGVAGGSRKVAVNVRLIAATNRDLRSEVASGRFREDLYYRLSTIQIRVPSLAERQEDVPALITFFIRKCNAAYAKHIQGLTRRAQMVLLQHSWPGNVRELENVISSASLVAQNDFIDVQDLPENLQNPERPSEPAKSWRPLPLQDVRKDHIERVLKLCAGNRVRAAQMLGIGRTSLYRYLKREGRVRPTGIPAA